MTSRNKRAGLGTLPWALFKALQWRVLLIWLVFMALPTAIAALPFVRALAGRLDYVVGSSALAHQVNGWLAGDVLTSLFRHGDWLGGAGDVALAVTVLLSPFLTAVAITAVKASRHPRLGELMHGGLRLYWRMLRVMLWGLLPFGVAVVVASVVLGVANHHAQGAILQSAADTGYLVARIVAAVVLVLAHAVVESSRAQFAADEGMHSATRAFGRGVSMLARRPLATLGLYLGTSVIGYALAGAVMMARVRTDAVGVDGYLAALVLAQLIVVVLAWQRTARLAALARLARATSFGGRSSAQALAPA